jgi:signal transduction histidine kinase
MNGLRRIPMVEPADPDQAEPPARSVQRLAPWFAVGSVLQHRARLEPEGPVRNLWYGALPYLLTTISVAGALYSSLALERLGVHNLEFALFLFAIASTIWYPRVGPAILAVLLSGVVFNYYFVAPRHTLAIELADVPYFAAFVLFALMVTGFGVVRRRAEQELIRSRDEVRREMDERQKGEEQVRTLNQQLRRKTADLEAANRELEAFAYSTSHDLRAPLRHMVGFAELLAQHAATALDEKSHRYLSTILDAAKRMGTLIDDLLAFSRIGRAESHETSIDLAPLVKEVIEQMAPDTTRRNIAWRIGPLPALHGDHSMLRLVFTNLITNAVKFTLPRERAEIEIGSFEDARGVVVFVKDNGVGFDMQYSDKLFGVFQRLHGTEEFEGTGIGLATAQRIIHRHGGVMWAEGAVNGGATFFLAVPPALRR